MEKPVITTQDFKDGEQLPECPHCYEDLVSSASEYGMCNQCAKDSGQYCSNEGCYAEPEVMTNEGLMCKQHGTEYLYDLYSETYQLVQVMEEEFDELVDLTLELKEAEGLKSDNPQDYYQKQGEQRAMTSGYSTKASRLRELKEEIEILQSALNIRVIDL